MNQFFGNQGQQQGIGGMYNYGQPQYWPGAYGYQQQQIPQLPVMTNPLTDEEHKMLQAQGGFNVTRDKLDTIRDMCTHKHNGMFTVITREDGLSECTWCGKVWEMKDNYTREDVDNVCAELSSIIETIKTFLLDVSPDVARQLFMGWGLLELIPQIFEYAMDTMKKIKGIHGAPNNGTGAAAQVFNNLYGLIGGMPGIPNQGYMMNQMQQQFPGYFQQAQQQQGMMQPQPFNGQPMMQQQAPQVAPQPMMPFAAPMQQAPQQANPFGPAPAGSFADRPVGVVVPNGPAPMQQPGMVTSNQVATTGPAPVSNTTANVPPVAPAAEAPAKNFKA